MRKQGHSLKHYRRQHPPRESSPLLTPLAGVRSPRRKPVQPLTEWILGLKIRRYLREHPVETPPALRWLSFAGRVGRREAA